MVLGGQTARSWLGMCTEWPASITYTTSATPGRWGAPSIDRQAFVGGGHFPKSRWGEPDAEDWNLAGIMSGYWTQFAATGDPNRTSLPKWPAYDITSDHCLDIGRKIFVRPTPSFGLQLGGQATDFVLLVMNRVAQKGFSVARSSSERTRPRPLDRKGVMLLPQPMSP